MTNFEKWLEKKFQETDGQGMPKDAMCDAYEGWLEKLDIEDWLRLGQEFKEAK